MFTHNASPKFIFVHSACRLPTCAAPVFETPLGPVLSWLPHLLRINHLNLGGDSISLFASKVPSEHMCQDIFLFVSVRYPSHDLFIILVKSIAKHCSFLAWWTWKEEFIRIFRPLFWPYGFFGGTISTMNRIDLESITWFNFCYMLYYVAFLWF